MLKLKKKDNFKNLPTWDLGDLYESAECEEFISDLEYCEDSAKNFEKKYKGKLGKLTAKKLFGAIAEYEIISEIMDKISTYAFLKYAENLSKEANTSLYQNVTEKITGYSSHLVFFSLEINKISDADLEKMYKSSKELIKYKPFIRDIRVFKKYELSEKLEKLFLEKNVTSANAWSRFFDETMDNMTFRYEKKDLNQAEILKLMTSKNGRVRKKAGKIFGKKLGENIKTFAYITNILAKDKSIGDEWRGFKNPISNRNLINFIEDEVVESLISTVKKNYPNLSYRYYKIKAKMMKKKVLHYTDRNAPLPFDSDRSYSWGETKKIVQNAYGTFSPELAKIGQKFFDNNWIDVPTKKGKMGGAFCMHGVPCSHPYLLLNFQGKSRDVMTLAHELGHGVHSYLSYEQGHLMSEVPKTLAETASVFGEQLTFREILKNTKDEKLRKALIANKVEDMLNTVVRQTAFCEFERMVHEERKKGEISVEKLCKFWMETQKECLGDGIKFDEEYKYYWAYVSHFVQSPFYVYAYAFGDCLVNSLYSVYQKNSVKDFDKKYIEMLKSGGTKHHKELLKPFGLDATKPDFWQRGMDVINEFINELEK
jgi:oligoendopeptidase F